MSGSNNIVRPTKIDKFIRESNKNECKTAIDSRRTTSGVKLKVDLNVKENSKNCYCNGGNNCEGAIRRIVDEIEMKDLMLSTMHQQKFHGQSDDIINDAPMKSPNYYEEWNKFYSFPRLHLTNNPDNDNQLEPFVLQPSLFHKNFVPPTIYFETKLHDYFKPPVGLPKSLQSYFRWKISSITPNSIRNCISFMKFDTIRPGNTTDHMYLGSWCKHMLTAEFDKLEEWRKVNHYPGSFHLGRKDKLWLRLRSNNRLGREKFDIHPTTFVLPRDYEQLKKYWSNSPSKLFIIKPPASARGNGIKVINDIGQIPESALQPPPQADGLPSKRSTMIVQQYISNPCLLENGQKFDLRVYVLLTSSDPLRIYVYDEGLVRFASMKYTSQEDGIIDQYMHLTNYFVNKNNQEYQINNDCESLNGCKWTLKRFWRYLREHYTHIDTQKLWDDIIDLIIKTIICCEGPMTRLSNLNCKNDYTSYELFGFDIILDENFKPWILEVNITPSLKSESDLDTSVKYKVIKDMFNTVGYNLPPAKPEHSARFGKDCRIFFDNRLYTQNLTKLDKAKHVRYQKLFKIKMGKNDQSSVDNVQIDNQETELVSPESNNADKDVLNGNNDCVDEDKLRKLKSDTEFHSDDELVNTIPVGDSILNELSQDDVRVLMLAEDELSRCGSFKRVFPSTTSSKYLKYFDRPRYYNLLLDAWEQRYRENRIEGIARLSSLATFLD